MLESFEVMDAQKTFVVKQGEDEAPVAGGSRKAGIGHPAHFNRKKQYAWLLLSLIKRWRQLDDENARMKKIVADLTLDREMLGDVKRSSGAGSEAQAERRDARGLGGIDLAGRWGFAVRPVHLPT